MPVIHRVLPLALVAAAALCACGGGSNSPTVFPPATLGDTVAVTAAGRVVSFNRTAPATLTSGVNLSGLASGENIVGIDVRPADGLVYAVSSLSRIYTLEPLTGALTLRATLSVPLAGSQFGVDFNPVADRLRIVGNTGQNLRVDVSTGAATVDGAINGAPATITASAYTNAFAGTTTTQLFNLDGAGTLYLQDPPNAGTQTTPVALGVTFAAANGFDIDPRNNTGYAALTVGGVTQLYTVPLGGSAGARAVGAIGTGEAIVGLTLVAPAAPRAYVLTDASQLTAFAPATPGTLSTPVAISGLASGETVLGIDFRPSNGRLYALTSAARLLTVVPETGVATVVATLLPDATDTTAPYTGLVGSRFAVDFNPVADRLRVIGDTGQSLRINVDTGATTTDGAINRATPASVVAAAYTNSFAGTAATTLYDLENNENVLAIQNPPNDGTLVNVGPTGVVLAGQGALDIAGGANGLVLAALRSGATGPFTLYTVSLATGAATLYGNTTGNAAASFIGGAAGPVVRDIAIQY
ncbi:DUF4394 domain-containing protein [Xylophilus sp. GOD-11R]|uniref:DUF4394 domain-containing protein n=1 Tax=Xylophilus sp. GOD-11R TaxID=3089814 RepID=UPI00298D465D|nr:DUF4394 domain-containing protein [Xylophilus sp. GOD-11R]WPB55734.1 DUF4394 domain-containing protein [Xylophilus sp. GOD-11R]